MSTPNLFEYMKQAQRFVRDAKQQLIDPGDWVDYANRARREVAMRSQCVRVVPPISGALASPSVMAPGSGYTNPTVVVSAPDFPSGLAPLPNGAQATATATLIGGEIASVDVTYGGAGYYQPVLTISDPTGTGATVTAATSWINQTIGGQEVYPFSSVNLSNFPLVDSILAVRSVSIIYADYRYSLAQYDFSTYQAKVRQFPFQYQYVSTFCSQFGQGVAGSLYMYPLPSQSYQMEWDCTCLPADLTLADGIVEDIIPRPWSEAVPYMMASLAYQELQNLNAARYYADQFDQFMHRYRAAATPGRISNQYGRW
jgi:hypothetical protein